MKYFGEEEEADEDRGDADTSLVEVGLSSAQYGALEVESVRMFPCELASECLFIKVFVLCMYFFFPSCSSACPAVNLCVRQSVREQLSCSVNPPVK